MVCKQSSQNTIAKAARKLPVLYSYLLQYLLITVTVAFGTGYLRIAINDTKKLLPQELRQTVDTEDITQDKPSVFRTATEHRAAKIVDANMRLDARRCHLQKRSATAFQKTRLGEKFLIQYVRTVTLIYLVNNRNDEVMKKQFRSEGEACYVAIRRIKRITECYKHQCTRNAVALTKQMVKKKKNYCFAIPGNSLCLADDGDGPLNWKSNVTANNDVTPSEWRPPARRLNPLVKNQRVVNMKMGHRVTSISMLASRQGEPGSIPGRANGFSQAGIVPHNAVGRRVFSRISRFPPPLNSGAAPCSLRSPSSALKTSLLRAAQISSLFTHSCRDRKNFTKSIQENTDVQHVYKMKSPLQSAEDHIRFHGPLNEGAHRVSSVRRVRIRRPAPSCHVFPRAVNEIDRARMKGNVLSSHLLPIYLHFNHQTLGERKQVVSERPFGLLVCGFLLIFLLYVDSLVDFTPSRTFTPPTPHSPSSRNLLSSSTFHPTRALGQAASVEDSRLLGCGSMYIVLGRRPESSPTRELRRGGPGRQPVSPELSCVVAKRIGISSRREEAATPTRLAAVGIHGITRRVAAGRERIVSRRGGRGGFEVGHLPQRETAEPAQAAAPNNMQVIGENTVLQFTSRNSRELEIENYKADQLEFKKILSEEIWAALNIEVLRADEGKVRRVRSSAGMKIRLPAESSGTILACKNSGAIAPGIEPGSPRWKLCRRCPEEWFVFAQELHAVGETQYPAAKLQLQSTTSVNVDCHQDKLPAATHLLLPVGPGNRVAPLRGPRQTRLDYQKQVLLVIDDAEVEPGEQLNASTPRGRGGQPFRDEREAVSSNRRIGDTFRRKSRIPNKQQRRRYVACLDAGTQFTRGICVTGIPCREYISFEPQKLNPTFSTNRLLSRDTFHFLRNQEDLVGGESLTSSYYKRKRSRTIRARTHTRTHTHTLEVTPARSPSRASHLSSPEVASGTEGQKKKKDPVNYDPLRSFPFHVSRASRRVARTEWNFFFFCPPPCVGARNFHATHLYAFSQFLVRYLWLASVCVCCSARACLSPDTPCYFARTVATSTTASSAVEFRSPYFNGEQPSVQFVKNAVRRYKAAMAFRCGRTHSLIGCTELWARESVPDWLLHVAEGSLLAAAWQVKQSALIRERRSGHRLKTVHDKESNFEINCRKISLPLPAYILTGNLSGMRPVKLATMDDNVGTYSEDEQAVYLICRLYGPDTLLASGVILLAHAERAATSPAYVNYRVLRGFVEYRCTQLKPIHANERGITASTRRFEDLNWRPVIPPFCVLASELSGTLLVIEDLPRPCQVVATIREHALNPRWRTCVFFQMSVLIRDDSLQYLLKAYQKIPSHSYNDGSDYRLDMRCAEDDQAVYLIFSLWRRPVPTCWRPAPGIIYVANSCLSVAVGLLRESVQFLPCLPCHWQRSDDAPIRPGLASRAKERRHYCSLWYSRFMSSVTALEMGATRLLLDAWQVKTVLSWRRWSLSRRKAFWTRASPSVSYESSSSAFSSHHVTRGGGRPVHTSPASSDVAQPTHTQRITLVGGEQANRSAIVDPLRKELLPLTAYILAGALSDTLPAKLVATKRKFRYTYVTSAYLAAEIYGCQTFNVDLPNLNRSNLKGVFGAPVAERLACSPPPRRTGLDPRPGHFRIFAWGNRAGRCRWSAGFIDDLQFTPPLSFRRCSILNSIALIDSQDLAVKSRQNLFIEVEMEQVRNVRAEGNGNAQKKTRQPSATPAMSPHVIKTGLIHGESNPVRFGREASSMTALHRSSYREVETTYEEPDISGIKDTRENLRMPWQQGRVLTKSDANWRKLRHCGGKAMQTGGNSDTAEEKRCKLEETPTLRRKSDVNWRKLRHYGGKSDVNWRKLRHYGGKATQTGGNSDTTEEKRRKLEETPTLRRKSDANWRKLRHYGGKAMQTGGNSDTTEEKRCKLEETPTLRRKINIRPATVSFGSGALNQNTLWKLRAVSELKATDPAITLHYRHSSGIKRRGP
ncbi:hypothetical protein PR048_025466 [Dryococelus australis]|uniref:Uncharacterized protein n=1 Tax=Dryococelus australis TaxID=614101 RepID=A0ABQ9GRC2_9NEOP|nr:hypothetical protein PR048_025466 [Dryococelus australis]